MKHGLLIGPVLWAMLSAAGAQAPPTPKTPPQPSAPPTASQGGSCASRSTGSDGSTTGQSSQLLADKLAQSDGVLCPPAGVDPEIRAPTPDAGTMPVIPPPGTPGGDPSVRPK